ncbi:hypothetical protein QYE76_019064 [Lolium multiflorum]|uniref:DUF4283 domain-containing protein n=1 Tax=Lolium multiflorum TaxID=4521 RepID=A0AAD8VMS0_LOLMU|nr:hypothetical protein QYE76_019064 [Lolium multiflorum]
MASEAGKGKAKGKEVEVEGVEGMLKKLQIAERRKVVGRPSASKKANPNQVVGKVLSEKLAHAVGIQDTLGKIWCPREGTICKELRKNVFLITFKQESGKRRALEGGPWFAGKDLLVLEDFIENKTLDEYEFRFFQMWVRVSNLPLGRMNRETGEQIGNAMGESVEVDVDEGGFAIGEFLRVRVKLDVREPIMRGIRVRLEEDEEEMGGREKQYGEVEGDEEEGMEEEEEADSARLQLAVSPEASAGQAELQLVSASCRREDSVGLAGSTRRASPALSSSSTFSPSQEEDTDLLLIDIA